MFDKNGNRLPRKQRGKKATEEAYMEGFSDGVNFMYMLEHPQEFIQQTEKMKLFLNDMFSVLQGKKEENDRLEADN